MFSLGSINLSRLAVTTISLGAFFFMGSNIPIEALNNDGTLFKEYSNLKQLVNDIKNGRFGETIPLNELKNSGAYQNADKNMQDCINLAAKIGHNLNGNEIVHCSQDSNYFKDRYPNVSVPENTVSPPKFEPEQNVTQANVTQKVEPEFERIFPETNATMNAPQTNATMNAPQTNATMNAPQTNATMNALHTALHNAFHNALQSNATQSNATRSNATRSNATRSNATRSNATLSNAPQTNASQSNASQSNASQSNATMNAPQSNASQSNATMNAPQTNASQSNATMNAPQSNASQSNATQSNATMNAPQTNASQSNASQSNATMNASQTNATQEVSKGKIALNISVGKDPVTPGGNQVVSAVASDSVTGKTLDHVFIKLTIKDPIGILLKNYTSTEGNLTRSFKVGYNAIGKFTILATASQAGIESRKSLPFHVQ